LLLRHGKSDWSSGTGDFDRPLAPRGLRDAPMMGRFLKNAGLTPDLIFSSPAKRAAETAESVAEASGAGGGALRFVDGFYGCSVGAYSAEIRRAPDSAGVLLLVGHNPTMEEAVSSFAAEGRLSLDFPTCALACLDIPYGAWSDFAPGTSSLRFFIVPKALKGSMR